MSEQHAPAPEREPVLAYDVAIMGGGLAGLTLALGLKRARPETTIFVAEKRQGPAPEAAFKVGESSVEIGAYYYHHICGLSDHLNSEHFRKLGLRFFCTAGDNSDITRRVEYSTPRHKSLYTYQIDRGRFENELLTRALAAGVDVVQGAFVDDVELGDDAHRVTIVRGGPGGDRSTVESRWVVDATGRAGLLKRKLGIGGQTDHPINSAWFRLDGGLDIEDWSDDPEWLDRPAERGLRKFSTNHLCGEGYWVWLISLASGPISIGVCADPRFHPFEQINELDRLLEWFKQHEPQLGAEVEARRDQVLDFLKLEDFSYTVERVYSPERWCLTGEAGAFLDPLYSPGSDYIAFGNSFITDLVTRDLDGEDLGNRVEFFNFFFFQLFNPALSLYRDQYQLLGNPQVMLAKQLYDNMAYFSTLPFMFFHGHLTRLDTLIDIGPDVQNAIPLLERMQGFFREWHALERREWEGVSVLEFPPMRERMGDLVADFDDNEFKARFKENVRLLQATAVVLFHQAAALLPEKPADDVPINPLGVGLQPERWEEDGLFSEPGITLVEARELLPGVERFFLEQRGAEVAAG
jgi:flavin-dependent dehydrogenase